MSSALSLLLNWLVHGWTGTKVTLANVKQWVLILQSAHFWAQDSGKSLQWKSFTHFFLPTQVKNSMYPSLIAVTKLMYLKSLCALFLVCNLLLGITLKLALKCFHLLLFIFRIWKAVQGIYSWFTLGKDIKWIKLPIFKSWKSVRYLLLMYVCWYSALSAILSNRLGTLNPVNFNYTALWCLLCFFLRFAWGTLPKWDLLPSWRACLPVKPKGTLWIRSHCHPVPGLSWQHGHSHTQLAVPAATLAAVAMGSEVVSCATMNHGCSETSLEQPCSCLKGQWLQSSWGQARLVKNTINLTLGCRQGKRRRKEETWSSRNDRKGGMGTHSAAWCF